MRDQTEEEGDESEAAQQQTREQRRQATGRRYSGTVSCRTGLWPLLWIVGQD